MKFTEKCDACAELLFCFPLLLPSMYVSLFFYFIMVAILPSEPMETINDMSSVCVLPTLSVRLVSSLYSGCREYLEHR